MSFLGDMYEIYLKEAEEAIEGEVELQMLMASMPKTINININSNQIPDQTDSNSN